MPPGSPRFRDRRRARRGRGARALSAVALPQGVEAPRLGLGTWELTGEECERAVATALDLGYRHVDTAEGYGNEEEVGRGIRGVDRESLFLTTKVWRQHLRPADLRARCEASLRRLRTDYVDLLLVHWPNAEIPIGDTIGGFERLKSDGRIRAWGVSNFTERHLEEALAHGTPATNQVELHPGFPQRRLRAFCEARGIPITAYSPLGRGRALEEPAVAEIARRRRTTPAQVVLAWALARAALVIPKASSRGHLEENLLALDLALSEEDLEGIDGIGRGERIVDGDWAEFDR